MDLTNKEKRIGQFFRLSVFLKGVHAVVEIVGGALLLVITPNMIVQLVIHLTQDELLQDPHDFIANYLLQASAGLSVSTTLFAALYLLSHGLIKIILVVGLLKNKLWAYPWSLVVLGFFILYQGYRFTDTHSLGLVFLTLFDLVVVWLIWQEYRIVRGHLSSSIERA